VAISRDGRRIVSGSGAYAPKIDENPAGRAGQDEFTLRLWDAQSGNELRRFGGNRFAVITAAISLDGRSVAAGCKNGTFRVWDVSSGRQFFEFTEPGGWEIRRVVFSPDSQSLLLASGETADFDSERNERELQGSTLPSTEVPTADATGSVDDRIIRLFDIKSGKQLREFRGHRSPVGDVAFSLDGREIVSGGSDNSVRVWDTQQGTQLSSLEGHANPVWRVSISRDGKFVLSGDTVGEVRLSRIAE
jgi:WD40 repeat protein